MKKFLEFINENYNEQVDMSDSGISEEKDARIFGQGINLILKAIDASDKNTKIKIDYVYNYALKWLKYLEQQNIKMDDLPIVVAAVARAAVKSRTASAQAMTSKLNKNLYTPNEVQ